MKPFLISLVVIVAIWAFFGWSRDHDKKTLQSYQLYEACVQKEYNTTPAHWYAEHGELPPCQP